MLDKGKQLLVEVTSQSGGGLNGVTLVVGLNETARQLVDRFSGLGILDGVALYHGTSGLSLNVSVGSYCFQLYANGKMLGEGSFDMPLLSIIPEGTGHLKTMVIHCKGGKYLNWEHLANLHFSLPDCPNCKTLAEQPNPALQPLCDSEKPVIDRNALLSGQHLKEPFWFTVFPTRESKRALRFQYLPDRGYQFLVATMRAAFNAMKITLMFVESIEEPDNPVIHVSAESPCQFYPDGRYCVVDSNYFSQ